MTDEGESPSLDYIEDPYFNPQISTSTPSLDDLDDDFLDEYDLLENELDIFDLRQLEFEDVTSTCLHNDESVNVETEFFNVKRANAIIRAFFRNKVKKQVRVRYSDLTKPYLAKLPKHSSFRKYLDISLSESGKYLKLIFKTYFLILRIYWNKSIINCVSIHIFEIIYFLGYI